LGADKAKKTKITEIGTQRQQLTEEKCRLDADAEWVDKSSRRSPIRAATNRNWMWCVG
jgi:hypothetical protein